MIVSTERHCSSVASLYKIEVVKPYGHFFQCIWSGQSFGQDPSFTGLWYGAHFIGNETNKNETPRNYHRFWLGMRMAS